MTRSYDPAPNICSPLFVESNDLLLANSRRVVLEQLGHGLFEIAKVLIRVLPGRSSAVVASETIVPDCGI